MSPDAFPGHTVFMTQTANARRARRPAKPVTAVVRSADDGLREEVTVGGRRCIVVDQPEAAGGTDTGPTPYELLAASIAGCVAITLRLYARRKGWPLDELGVEACLDREDRPERCTVTVRLPGGLSAEQCARLRQVAKACPVHRTLACGIAFEHHVPAPS